MARIQLAADSFVRADSTTLGANWSASLTGANTLQVVSNSAEGTALAAAIDNCNIYTATVPPNDQWAQVTIGAIVTASSYNAVSVGVRCDPTSTSPGITVAPNGYVLVTEISLGGGLVTQVFLAGSSGQLTTKTTRVVVAGDVMRIQATGTTISGWHNDVKIFSTVDTVRTSGNAFIEVYPDLDLTASVISSFSMGGFNGAFGLLSFGLGV